MKQLRITQRLKLHSHKYNWTSIISFYDNKTGQPDLETDTSHSSGSCIHSHRHFHTAARRQCVLYDKQYRKSRMSGTHERIVVKLRKDALTEYQPAPFSQCIIDYIDPSNTDGTTTVSAALFDNRLHISPPCQEGNEVKIKHPPFCPIHHMTQSDMAALPPETSSRGIDCGAAVILESGDGKILLTRRGNHLRTFPGIWVPPGGHIEENETLQEAGLRELKEETGLTVTPDMCCDNTVQTLAMWESVFPPKLSLGLPKRHHAVIYIHAKLKPDITSLSLMDQISIDPTEVGAAAWFERSHVKAITLVKETDGQTQANCDTQNLSTSSFSAIVLNEETKQQVFTDLPFADLLKLAGNEKDQIGRVSTGTKFALEEWLIL